MNDQYYNNIFYRTTDLHLQFEGKSVFIAGHTGFYGRWFLGFFEFLKKSGINVEVHGGSFRSTGLDVCNWRTYHDHGIFTADYVINCAGDAQGGDMLTHSMGGVALRAAMSPNATLLQFSSGAAANPTTDYAVAKSICETRLSGWNNVQIVRPFATVGPNMGWGTHFAIPTFLRKRTAKVPLEVAPGVSRSFCHIVDLVVQCLHVMVAGDGKPYEVGSDNVVTMEEAARLISDDVKIVEKDYPTNAAAKDYRADLSRIRNQFNLELDFDSKAAILDTVRWYFTHESNRP